MRIYLIRHGKTPGNQLNRYIGITDEPVLEEDQEQLKKDAYIYCRDLTEALRGRWNRIRCFCRPWWHYHGSAGTIRR